MLSVESYIDMVASSQLISIDLLVRNKDGKILLGKRRISPAKGWYFVPGGRVYKNETLKEGATRVLRCETGLKMKLQPRCVSEHIYPENFCGAKDQNGKVINTHYVCFAFDVDVESSSVDENAFKLQHEDMIWVDPEDISSRADIHEYVRLYFTPDAYNRF